MRRCCFSGTTVQTYETSTKVTQTSPCLSKTISAEIRFFPVGRFLKMSHTGKGVFQHGLTNNRTVTATSAITSFSLTGMREPAGPTGTLSRAETLTPTRVHADALLRH